MANRHIQKLDVIFRTENTPFVPSFVGISYIINECRMDDTIGPCLDIHLTDGEESMSMINWEPFVFVKISAYDASHTRCKRTIYHRSIEEYNLGSHIPLLRRYRVPFSNIEQNYMGNDDWNGIYHGNPDVYLVPGDMLEIQILSPWVIDFKKSAISLEALELRGHIGPKEILVDPPTDFEPVVSMGEGSKGEKYAFIGDPAYDITKDVPECYKQQGFGSPECLLKKKHCAYAKNCEELTTEG